MISDTDKYKAVLREIKKRRYVYPRAVAEGRMSEKEAKWQIDIFESILADYEPKAAKERLL